MKSDTLCAPRASRYLSIFSFAVTNTEGEGEIDTTSYESLLVVHGQVWCCERLLSPETGRYTNIEMGRLFIYCELVLYLKASDCPKLLTVKALSGSSHGYLIVKLLISRIFTIVSSTKMKCCLSSSRTRKCKFYKNRKLVGRHLSTRSIENPFLKAEILPPNGLMVGEIRAASFRCLFSARVAPLRVRNTNIFIRWCLLSQFLDSSYASPWRRPASLSCSWMSYK